MGVPRHKENQKNINEQVSMELDNMDKDKDISDEETIISGLPPNVNKWNILEWLKMYLIHLQYFQAKCSIALIPMELLVNIFSCVHDVFGTQINNKLDNNGLYLCSLRNDISYIFDV